ncbi:hypothetical protein [Helicobacter himalayensis]|uniref:hypothetical protein n=1 Tax=Helicobacter himalayensis TaxID=1591088 RepID=UPI00082C9701|nr:hypothetical protein [Helicobacter himalayensis]
MENLSPQAFFILVSFFSTILIVLIVLLYLFGPSPKKRTQVAEEENSTHTIDTIMAILDNQKSTPQQLQKAVNIFFDEYDSMDLSDYKKKAFFFALVIHKNVSTELILQVDEDLKKLNPNMERELTKTLNRALDARGA